MAEAQKKKRKKKGGAPDINHTKFIEAYVRLDDAKAAALECGYSKRNPAQMGYYLVKRLKKEIDARRAEVLAKAQEATQLTVEGVLRELHAIVHADPADFFDEQGRLKPMHLLTPQQRKAIASIEVVEEFEGKGKDREATGFNKKLKFWDKNAGIDKAMKHLGLFEKDNKQQNELPTNVCIRVIGIEPGSKRRR